MTTFLTFTILGLVLGSVYAIAASGLVLTYNTSGIFNFAHGAQAMLGTFLYWQLSVGWGLPVWLSLVLVVGVFGPLMGLVLHSLIMGALRDTAEVAKIVVTVAVMLGMVYLSQWIWDPSEPRTLTMFFGSDASVEIAGVVVRVHEILCLVVALAIALGLRVLFQRSRVGVVMRGTVDNPELLRLNGHDPARVAALSWALGSALAVLAGILITPVSGGSLEAHALTLLVIDAFAAAMFGRLRSIPPAFVGAMVLGLLASYLTAYAPTDWTWAGNFRVSLPMVLLFIVIIALPHDRLRGAATRTRERYRVPTVRSAAVWGLVLVGFVFLYSLLLEDSGITTLGLGMTFAIIALSLTVLTGYAGEMNLAPMAFGAIATVIAFHFGITGTGLDASLNLPGILLAVLATAVVGGLVALPALRLRGLYLALATLAFGVLLSNMVLRDTVEHTLFGFTFTLFPEGTLVVPKPKVGPVDMSDPLVFLLVATALFALIALGLAALRNNGYGRRLAAMKDSPAATAMLGQNLVKLKLGVFMLSAAIAGLGGILMSSAMGSVEGETFGIMASLALVMLVVVGGIGYLSGALFGGVMSGVGFVLLVGTFNDLAIDQPQAATFFKLLGNVVMVGTALIGMGVGKTPSGSVQGIFDGYRSLRNARPVLIGGAAFVALLYVLALVGVFGSWTFTLLAMVVLMALPTIGQKLMPHAVIPVEGHGSSGEAEIRDDEPYTDVLRDRLDLALGLPPRVHGVRPAAPAPQKGEVNAPA